MIPDVLCKDCAVVIVLRGDGCRERISTMPSCLNRMLRWNAHPTSALLVLAVAAMNV